MTNRGTCSWCGKDISRTGPGADWYHRRSVSTSCFPGKGSWKRASPVEVPK